VVGFSSDEAQNLWVATPSAVYVMKPGETSFHRYSSRDGLHLQDNPFRYCDSWENDCPVYGSADSRGIAEITGGLAGEVYVGYWAVDETPDGKGGTLPPDQYDPGRHNGQLDRVQLNADGSITVTRLQMSSSHNIHWWHNRTVQRLAFDHFVHHNELFVGTNHGVDRLVMDKYREPGPGEFFNTVKLEWMADHLHPVAAIGKCDAGNTENCYQKMGEWRALALDPKGDLWVGGRWSAGKILWIEPIYDTVNPDGHLGWASRTGSAAFAPALGLGNAPVFPVSQQGDPVSLSAVSVATDGRVWWASGPWYNGPKDIAYGVAVTDSTGFHTTFYSPGSLGLNEQNVRDLIALPDGRIALAGWSSGIALYDPATGKSVQLHAPQDLPSDEILRLELDTMVSPWVLHVATAGGAASLRKLPQ
jgi:hypothetical protein